MPRPREWLRRFRLMAVPGSAGLAGVPVDRAAALREESAPVLTALLAIDRDAAATVSRATAEAARRRAAALAGVKGIVASAHEAEPGARSDAAQAQMAASQAEALVIRDNAHREAQRVRRRVKARLPEALDDLVRGVLETGRSAKAPS